MRLLISLRAPLWAVFASCCLQGAEDIVIKAMRDELARSMAKLQLEILEKPYFIAYRVQERASARTSASFGSLLSSNESRVRSLGVEVRVGNQALDNTNFLSGSFGGSGVIRMFGGTLRLPLEDDYKELRRQIWLATDGAYKRALEDLAKKRAALQNKTRTEEIPDLSREEITTIADDREPLKADRAALEATGRELSALFREMPAVFHSTVELTAGSVLTRYVNSEGTSFRRLTQLATFTAVAGTQAANGMPLEDFVAAYGRTLADLPKKDELAARIRETVARLAQLRDAPVVDQYNGPVLFEGQAAAELVSQALAGRLLASRRPVSDNPQFESASSQGENPFLDKLGARVLPRFLNLVDDPTIQEHEKTILVGGYAVDDDGVRAAPAKLVENGILKTLLSTRNPARGISRSTGHRRGAGPLPSNLFLTAEKGLDAAELKTEFLNLVKERGKEFGIVVRKLGNPALRAAVGGGGSRLGSAILAYKVFPDGREELIRNAELSGINESAFKDIAAASKASTVYSAPFAARGASAFSILASPDFGGDPGGSPVVSLIVPSLLFEDITVKKPSGEIPNLPASKHPFFDR